MANPDSVSQNTQDSFSNYLLARVRATQLNTTGNAAITIPILGGGLTNGGAVANSGGVIIRRITVQNPSGSVASANVAIATSNDGNISNAVVANVVLSAVSAAGRYQDLTINGAFGANTTVSGNNTSALYVIVNTASGNANTVDLCVWGDVVNF